MINLQPKSKWILAGVTTLIGVFLAISLNINDNALDLLPDTAVKGDLLLFQKLGLVNRVIISLSIDDTIDDTIDDNEGTADLIQLKKSTLALGSFLETSEFFTNVIYHLPQKFELQAYQKLQPLLPLLLDDKDIRKLQLLTTPDGIERALQKSFNLLNSPAGYGLKRQIQGDPLEINALFLEKLNYLRAEYSLLIEDGMFLSRDKRSSLLIAESTKELTDSDSAIFINQILQQAFQTVVDQGIVARTIGSLPHTLANAGSVQHDLRTLLPVATLLLLTLLLYALRSFRALLVLIIPFLAAPSAIAFTGIIFGEISALALGFGIVLLGIAVDFSIHLYLGLSCTKAPDRFLRDIRKPILLATLTTASVFIVLLFSGIPAHRQMAFLALSGILLALVYSWYLVPLIIGRKRPAPIKVHALLALRPSLPVQRSILILWLALVVAGVISWPGLRYNGNLQTLDAPSATVIDDEEHFKKTWGGKGDQAFIVASADELDQALRLNYQIYKELQSVQSHSFQSIAPLLPSLADQAKNLAGWQQFWQDRGPEFQAVFQEKAAKLGFSPQAFSPFFDSLQNTPAAATPATAALYEKLPDGLKLLVDTSIRLPGQQPGKAGDNKYLVVTTLSTDDELFASLLHMDQNNQHITLLANKKWRDQVEKMLRHDILTLSLAAAAIITLITLLAFRRLRTTVAVLAPIISALSAMALFSSLTGKELNMMHLLMGIMVIGLAVDYGIFMVCSQDGPSSPSSLAVSVCAVSSLIGFGVLSFAQHPALSALGITVLIGIGVAWPTALLVTPTIMGHADSGRNV